jgi:hypothetical protein
MSLGGGTFITQNKVLPGSYINFVSVSKSNDSIADRGVVAMALELDWGKDNQAFKVTYSDFINNAKSIFGYDYNSSKMKGLRELFKNIKYGIFYKLGTGTAAQNTYATAACKGVRGNDLKIVISTNVEDNTKFDVQTVLDGSVIDEQKKHLNTDTLKDNSWITWKTNVSLTATAGLQLAGGANPSSIVAADYQAALDAFESYSFNVLGCLSTSTAIEDLFIAYTKRMRNEEGVKFQTVVYKRETANDEGIISVENTVSDDGALASSLVYWVTGAESGCQANKSLTNKEYDGEFAVNVDYTQSDLESALEAGKLMFHRVGDSVRVLEDINTLTTYTSEKTSDFADNQVIRVIDQVANDIATLFNTKYLGNIQNNESGRLSLWNDIVSHHKKLQASGAIEDFDSTDITVIKGSSSNSVVVNDLIKPANTMSQLYMTVVVE